MRIKVNSRQHCTTLTNILLLLVFHNTHTILPSVQIHDKVFWFWVPKFHSALVTMRIVCEFFRVEIHIWYVLSRLRGHIQRVIVLHYCPIIGLTAFRQLLLFHSWCLVFFETWKKLISNGYYCLVAQTFEWFIILIIELTVFFFW